MIKLPNMQRNSSLLNLLSESLLQSQAPGSGTSRASIELNDDVHEIKIESREIDAIKFKSPIGVTGIELNELSSINECDQNMAPSALREALTVKDELKTM